MLKEIRKRYEKTNGRELLGNQLAATFFADVGYLLAVIQENHVIIVTDIESKE